MKANLDIENLLKENLLNERQVVPSHVFKKIENSLKEKRKRRFIIWFFFGVLLMLSTIFIAYFYVNLSSIQNNSNKLSFKNSQKNKQKQIKKPSLKSEKNTVQFKKLKKNIFINYKAKLPSKTIKIKHILKHKNNSFIDINASRIETTTKPLEDKTNIESVKKNNAKISLGPTYYQSADSNKVLTLYDSLTIFPYHDDSTQLNLLDSTKLDESLYPGDDNIVSTEISAKKILSNKKWALLIFGGPDVYKLTIFKPYFSSGLLSKHSSESKGYEIGFGFELSLLRNLNIYSTGSYNQKETQFNYNLGITASDYFSNYLNQISIPVTNLDNSDNCNCFLAEDVNLHYKIESFHFTLGTHINLLNWKRFQFSLNLNTSVNLMTQYKHISSKVVGFDSELKEYINSIRLGAGPLINFKLNDWVDIRFTPSYLMTFHAKSTKIFSQRLNEIYMPIQLKFRL